MGTDPAAGGKAAHHAAVKAPGQLVVDVLQARRQPEPRLLEQPGQAAVLPECPLLVDEQAEPLFEGQPLDVGLACLRQEALGQAVKAHLAQPVDSLSIEHVVGHLPLP